MDKKISNLIKIFLISILFFAFDAKANAEVKTEIDSGEQILSNVNNSLNNRTSTENTTPVILTRTVVVNNYADLKTAVESAEDGDTIKFGDNITFDARSYIPVKKSVTIDLNGYTAISPSHYVFASGGENVVIKNGMIEAPYAGVSASSGTLYLENVKITGSDTLVSVNKNSSVIIDKDSVINATGSTNYPAIQITGSYDEENTYNPYLHIYGTINANNETAILGNGKDKNISHIYVYDGAVINSNKTTFYMPQPCDINVLGGTISGSSVFGIKSGSLNLTGGILTANGEADYPGLQTHGSGIYTAGAVIHIDSNKSYVGNIVINISQNVKLQSVNAGIIKEIGLEEETTSVVSVNVTGGTLLSHQDYTAIEVRDITKENVSVSGGTFNIEVLPDLLAEGYIQNYSSGFYTVALPVQKIESTVTGTIGTANDSNLESTLLESLNESSIDTSLKNVLVSVNVKDNVKPSSNDNKKIKSFANKSGLIISKYFDIDVIVKNSDTGEQLGILNNLTKKIKLMLSIPESLKNVSKNYKRVYYIVRLHDGKTELLSGTLSEDGNSLFFESDKFSTYALTYTDEKIVDNTKPSDDVTNDINSPSVDDSKNESVTDNSKNESKPLGSVSNYTGTMNFLQSSNIDSQNKPNESQVEENSDDETEAKKDKKEVKESIDDDIKDEDDTKKPSNRRKILYIIIIMIVIAIIAAIYIKVRDRDDFIK